MQDRPTAEELIEAVIDFLQTEVAPAVAAEPRLRFGFLIAANVLGIVAREVAAGDGPLLAEWEGLCQLLGQPTTEPPAGRALRPAIGRMNGEVGRRIRAGEADDGPWREAVLAHTQATVVEKLKLANPRYLENAKVGRGILL